MAATGAEVLVHLDQTNSIALPPHNKRKRWLTRFSRLRYCAHEPNMQWPSTRSSCYTIPPSTGTGTATSTSTASSPATTSLWPTNEYARTVASECRALNATLLLILMSVRLPPSLPAPATAASAAAIEKSHYGVFNWILKYLSHAAAAVRPHQASQAGSLAVWCEGARRIPDPPWPGRAIT